MLALDFLLYFMQEIVWERSDWRSGVSGTVLGYRILAMLALIAGTWISLRRFNFVSTYIYQNGLSFTILSEGFLSVPLSVGFFWLLCVVGIVLTYLAYGLLRIIVYNLCAWIMYDEFVKMRFENVGWEIYVALVNLTGAADNMLPCISSKSSQRVDTKVVDRFCRALGEAKIAVEDMENSDYWLMKLDQAPPTQ
jgi:hypothetical protein